MFEKVNPHHPDKLADRIAGAMVDLAYTREQDPRVAVEVLLGHGYAYVIAESSVAYTHEDVEPIIRRITGTDLTLRLLSIPQDAHLADNQGHGFRCGDNGIFRGAPVTPEQALLARVAQAIHEEHPTDGKYIIRNYTRCAWETGVAGDITAHLIVCQSQATNEHIREVLDFIEYSEGTHEQQRVTLTATINPLGPWTGGPDVDSGATNRKLGSDMGDGVTGGGLCGKDLSKADVSVNIYCHLLAQQTQRPVTATCAIGDEEVIIHRHLADGKPPVTNVVPYAEVVRHARRYIAHLGGFEHFAAWGLIRPEYK